MDLTEIDALARRVVDQVELVQGEIPGLARVAHRTEGECGEDELHGLLQVDGLVEGFEGPEHQPGGSNAPAGHEDPIGAQTFDLPRSRVPGYDVRLTFDLV